MSHDIISREALHAFITAHGHLRGRVIQELDLRRDGALLRTISCEQSVFLGCEFDPATLDHLYRGGAELFPPLRQELPFRPYRKGLYTIDELYEGFDPGLPGSFWRDARDSRIYDYFNARRHADGPLSIMDALAMRLHDHAIEDALDDLLHHHRGEPLRVAAVMGGHAMHRGDPMFAEIARATRALTRAGDFIATGGGPGAMEAANLGAYLAPHDDAVLERALTLLAGEPDFRQHRYIELALEVRRRWPAPPGQGESLAIPTWFYGHEPSNVFASHIAKYFANSVREDGLLAIATAGVIYAPGSAGTLQEIFIDVCQNHYVTFEVISPMVMLGETYWTETLPVWPLLQAMSEGRPWATMLALCDCGDEAVDFIRSHPPFSP